MALPADERRAARPGDRGGGGIRGAVIDELTLLAERDERIVFLTADLGFMVVEDLAARVPERFFNVGVAEQNMVGVATGLAARGFVPYCYTIAPFATLRPLEFVRNGPLLHRLPVRIIGVGSGFDYAHGGATHHGLEDVAVMRALPGMTVVVPADAAQARAAVRATVDVDGPLYLRIGKDERPDIPGLDGRFALGRAHVVRDGRGIAIVASGTASGDAVAAAAALNARVVLVSSVRPAPVEDLRRALADVDAVVTVEHHGVDGGIGSLVCEVVAEAGLRCRVRRLGAATLDAGPVGSARWLASVHGVDAASIEAAARAVTAS